jgi:hypothetical protein
VSVVTCPGCGAVLAPAGPDDGGAPDGALPCRRLFEVTLGGLREDAVGDPAIERLVHLADDAYAAQHGGAAARTAVERLADRLGVGPVRLYPPGGTPTVWQTTITDVAADLDVVDLPVLVESWARAVLADWRVGR